MSQGLHKMPVHWLPHYNEHLPEYSPGVLNGMAKHGVACQWYWGVCFREWIQGSGQGSNPIVDWMRCFRSFEPYPCIIELHQSPFMTLPDLRYHFLSSEYRYTGYTALHRFACQRKERMKDPLERKEKEERKTRNGSSRIISDVRPWHRLLHWFIQF